MTGAFRLGSSTTSTAGVSRSLAERVRSVGFASMAYWYYRWDWGEAIALDGLDAGASITDESLFTTWVDREVDGWLLALAAGDATALGPMGAVIRRLDRYPNARRQETLDRVEEFVTGLSGLNSSGTLAFEADVELVFVDSLYGFPASLVQLALARDDDSLIRDVVGWAERHCDLLQDPATGLFAHYAPLAGGGTPIAWGRGNGWAALGLADLVATVPQPLTNGLTDRYRLLVDGLVSYEVSGGGWRNLIDEPSSYPEASTTALIVASIGTAGSAMHIGAEAEASMRRGWSVLADRVDVNGHVVGVSYRPGINTTPARYEHAPVVGAYPWGQGSWLRAAAVAAPDWPVRSFGQSDAHGE